MLASYNIVDTTFIILYSSLVREVVMLTFLFYYTDVHEQLSLHSNGHNY